MQKGSLLQFACPDCHTPLHFSIFDLENHPTVNCQQCAVAYDFNEETLMRQLRQFTSLCREIQASKEILSSASVGVHVGDREVKIPFNILLSRLNSSLDLMIGDRSVTVYFRFEPTLDVPK